MPNRGLSFVTPIAYDFVYSFASIRSYYDIADEIILGVDEERLTWSGQPYKLDDNLFDQFVTAVDVNKKIRFAAGNFHSQPHPMANDVLERRALGMACKPENWVVQIDSDEVIANAAEFAQWMSTADESKDVSARWLTVFKTIGTQALVIDGAAEWTAVATMTRNQYALSRETPRPKVRSPLKLVHWSWGRQPAELHQKLTNWGHARDFDIEAFFAKWQTLTLDNYNEWKDFHPLAPTTWPRLRLVDMSASPPSSATPEPQDR